MYVFFKKQENEKQKFWMMVMSGKRRGWLSGRLCLPMQEMQEMQIRSLGWEDPLKEEMATHSSILAWKIPWTEESGMLHSMGLQRVGYYRAHTCVHTTTTTPNTT